MKSEFLFLITVSVFLAGCSRRQADPPALRANEVACPATVTTRQSLTGSGEGWTVQQADAAVPLSDMLFYYDDPVKQGGMHYTDEKQVEEKETLIWDFNLEANGPPMWLACRYDRSAIMLARPLARSITRCSMTFAGKYATGNAVLTCK